MSSPAWGGLSQGQGLFRGREHEFSGHLRGQQPTMRREQASRQVARWPQRPPTKGKCVMSPTHTWVWGGGSGLAEQSVFGHHGGRVGHGRAGPLRTGAQRVQAQVVQSSTQRVAPHRVAFGAQFGPQPPGTIAAGRACKGGMGGRVPEHRDDGGPLPPLVIASCAHGQQAAKHLHGPRLRAVLDELVTTHV
ncbi:hypothetical protein [Hymenobacter elongatus]|uniref:Uncharacterized protein n=1 Tax=Hymenobacter elongatus TaxID=877208 RepID=A0A4Z0PE54_9BACT|nr:hypothetical protein [Hymenobacter elongatus]TGE12075.1 hypothetical protein E5J99_20550 [Hymenobacter elongatus]